MERCEICNDVISLVTHHIQSISMGGDNKKYNKSRICPNCHDSVHRGSVIIEGRFECTNGNMLVYRGRGEESITGVTDPLVWIYK